MVSRYLSPAQAAETLGCSVKTVYRMVKAGELMGITVGSRIRIEANSLPSPDGPRRIPAPRASKYGAPGTMVAIAREVNAHRRTR